MRYNLLTYGTLETLTESGTGNVELTADNLSVLVDGIIDSSYYYIPEGTKHYTVWSWTDKSSTMRLSNDCLTTYCNGGGYNWRSGRAVKGVSSGKYYWDARVNQHQNHMLGVTNSSASLGTYFGATGTDVYSWSYYSENGNLYHAGISTAFGSTFAAGDRIGIALDLDNNKLWFSKNGVWVGTGADPGTGSVPAASLVSGTYYPGNSLYYYFYPDGFTANFGASNFAYTVPSGFNAGIQMSDQGPYMSSVFLETTDTIYIESDLSNRIKIDELRMYLSSSTSSGTILGNINFYYKEELSDNYIQLDKAYNADYFYATNLSGVFTPRYLRYTVENTECILTEIEAYNDDDIVDFGSDGLLTEYNIIEDTPDSVYPIDIFNDNIVGSLSAHAYVAIDYVQTETHIDTGSLYYNLELSASENGPFYSVNDGLVIDDNYESSTYSWSNGVHNHTKESNGYLVLSPPTYIGTYETPVFKFDDPYMSSYLYVGITTESGTTSVGYDDNIFDNTIEVRSSDTKPMELSDVYWVERCNVYRYTYYDNTTTFICTLTNDGDWWESSSWGFVYLKNPKTMRTIRMCRSYYSNRAHKYYYDENNSRITRIHNSYDVPIIYPNLLHDLDMYDYTWGYGNKYNSQYHLTRVAPTNTTRLVDIYKGGYVDFVADFAVELNGTGLWYTDKIANSLVHLDASGSTLGTVSMLSVGSVASTSDNGCWVLDINNKQAFAFDCESVPLTVVNLVRPPTVNTRNRMDTDRDDGFWYYSDDGYVCHVDKYGKLGVEIPTSLVVTKVTGGDGIVMIYSSSERKFEIYNTQGVFLGSKSITSGYMCIFPSLLYSVDNVINPQSYDPVWGDNGSLEWNVVKNSGYFLPKTTYHQARLTLRTYDVEETPTVHNIIAPPAVKIQDIYPQQSRNVYFKSNLSGEAHGEYEVDLKVWWEI